MPFKFNPLTNNFDLVSSDEIPTGGLVGQYLAVNDASTLGYSWQKKGFTYLTDELGKVLTDENNNALEGKDAAVMDYSISTFTSGRVLFVTTGGAITEDSSFTYDGTEFTAPSATVSDLTATRLMASNSSKGLSSVADLTDWIAGTSARITFVSDADGTGTIDIASTYVGQTSITTLGTITTGTWTGTTIAVDQGGTGQASYTNGQLLIGNTTGNTLTKATLTAGTGISITNSTGAIAIATDGAETLTHTTKTDNYTLTSSDQVIIFKITAAKVATLLDPTGNSGKTFAIINKYDSTFNVTFSRNINGDGSFALQPGEVINFMSDGTEYLIHQ